MTNDKAVEKIKNDFVPILLQFRQGQISLEEALELQYKILQAILADPSIMILDKLEREHILETQQILCNLAKTPRDDGSCSICQDIKEKLAG